MNLVSPAARSIFRRHGVLVLTCALLLLPMIFASPQEPGFGHIGIPCVFSGDEPHYLVTINSVLNGRLDTAQTYQAVHDGAPYAGWYFSGWRLDHHTVWFEGDQRRQWSGVYDVDPSHWDRDGSGKYVPRLAAPDVVPPAPGHPEYSTHPYGLALMLAPVLFPFRNTVWVEPMAILCSGLVTIAALLFFRALAFKYTSDRMTVNLAGLVTFLGTPAWCYGRSLFNEPYLLMFAIGAYSLALRNRLPLVVGLFIGLGMLMKPTFLVFLVPLWFRALWYRRIADLLLLPVAPLLAFITILSLDQIMFGSPWRSMQAWMPGNFLTGAVGNLISLKYGYLVTSPVLLVALMCWPAFFMKQRPDAIVLGAAVLIHYSFLSCWGNWAGPTCYGARYMVPLIPLVLIALVELPNLRLWQSLSFRYAAMSLGAISIILNGIAAMPYWAYWDSNPVRYVLQESFGLPAGW